MFRFKQVLLLLLLFITQKSIGSVDIYPHKLVFEPGQRSTEVILINSDDVAYTYRMGWSHIYYSDNGGIIEEPEFKTPSASKMIRYAPRQVILQPGESQSIRVMVRRPKGLKDGEYRSHMLFQQQASVPTEQEMKDRASQSEQSEGFSMNLYVAIGMTIPVIIRQGEGEPKVDVKAVEIIKSSSTDGPSYVLSMKINRVGLYSSRITVDVEGNDEKSYIKNASYPLYTDTENYHFTLPLPAEIGKENSVGVSITQEFRRNDEKIDSMSIKVPH